MELDRSEIRIPVPIDAVADFCRRHQIRELALFGSVLRDDFTRDSDVDVLIEMDPDRRFTLREYMRMEEELVSILGRRVDMVKKDLLSKYIAADVLATRRVLYVAPQ